MASGAVPVDKLYDHDQIFAIRDINPRAPTHILIIPYEHISMVSDLGPQHGDLLARMYQAANEVARNEGLAERGYRCTFNVGPEGGQTIYHIHMHLLGGRQLGPEA